MKTALLLLLLFCLAEADDIRREFESFKSQLEGQLAALTLEMTQLKSDVKKIKFQCPSGWTKFGDSCYISPHIEHYISDEKKTWQQSREDCQNKGADLVVINSKEEKDFALNLGGRGKGVWLGLTDSETEGEWKWVDGTPLTTQTYWGDLNGGLRNDEESDCAFFYDEQWMVRQCGHEMYWMCEMVF